MTISFFLKPLILIGVILVLLICWIAVLSILFRQRYLLRKLMNQLIDLRNQTSAQQLIDHSGLAKFSTAPSSAKLVNNSGHFNNANLNGNSQPNDSAVINYFVRAIGEAIHHYEKLTFSKTVVFDPTAPYAEKVAALRYLYLTIEQEAEQLRETKPIQWSFYEEKFERLLKLLNKKPEDIHVDVLNKQLQEYKTENKTTINRLKNIIDSLQHTIQQDLKGPITKELQKALEHITSNDNYFKIRELFEELKTLSESIGANPNPIERSISTLEYEIEASDKLFTNMKSHPEQHPANLQELKKLRESNKIQRGTISSLEDEILLLRDSMTSSMSEELKEEKENEIKRLERIVKEYEGCVIILEDQIDSLYTQLEQQREQTELNNNHKNNEEQNNHLKDLNQELESVSNRMNSIANDYRYAVSMNRAIYSFCQSKTVKDIASTTINLLKEFDAPAGFIILSSVGKAEYFPSSVFNEALKNSVKQSNQKEHMSYLNGNHLFVDTRIKLLLLSRDDVPDSINTTISGLVCAANVNILRLENNYNSNKRNVKMKEWIDTTKTKIGDLDIQYAYQIEENKRIYGEFIADLKKAYSVMELKGDSAMLLENAINQYDVRMQLSVLSADVIDRELAKLREHVNNLES